MRPMRPPWPEPRSGPAGVLRMTFPAPFSRRHRSGGSPLPPESRLTGDARHATGRCPPAAPELLSLPCGDELSLDVAASTLLPLLFEHRPAGVEPEPPVGRERLLVPVSDRGPVLNRTVPVQSRRRPVHEGRAVPPRAVCLADKERLDLAHMLRGDRGYAVAHADPRSRMRAGSTRGTPAKCAFRSPKVVCS